ncbi:class I SAM-dependent DNA methyltransferase [Saccharothrix syringae]|uniref:Class I SAM-dependent methyltransferase n=1 Tax=Saccharothrix syringae TaxID=103733 RepID=A0A5Q0H9S5_SACSY|nr:class I SAM-dependent methyltransferase [Saccharothrix syringae]QFZ22693.1 class I SAM-dependent methyltransferase [Saccharothrix syringae]
MTEPSHLTATRESYDTVAETYAEFVKPRFGEDVLGRALLGAFVELTRGVGPVLDAGCGPGQVTAHLAGLGASVLGVDLSPRMVGIARREHPDLRFEVGSMTALDQPDGAFGGVLAWSSTMHLPPAELPGVLAGFHRVLAPGGHLLMGFHVGDEHLAPETAYGGHPVSYEWWLRRPDDVAALLEEVGFGVAAQVVVAGEKRPHAYLLGRRA